MAVHEQFPVLSWKSESMDQAILWTAESIREERGKRTVEQERAYRHGAKIDSTGWKGRQFRIKSAFNNTLDEPGVGDLPLMYPDRLNALIRSFDFEETGTLTLPTRGPVRCKASWYGRGDEIGEDDEASCEFVFLEDSEDEVNPDTLADPQVNATIVRLSQQTVFSAERLGSLNDGYVDLVTAASQMETLLLAPGRALDDIKSQGNRNRRAIKRAVFAEQKLGKQVGGLFQRQDAHEAERQSKSMSDLQARAIAEKNADRPATRKHRVSDFCTLFDVSSDVGKTAPKNLDLQALFELNQGVVDDVMDLSPGQRVVVFQ